MAAGGRSPRPEVIWARPERTGRGPRPAHTRAEIAGAAVRVADADGIEAVSMRRVAAEVGCGTMSLYNYVPRKEDLYELMVDAVSAEHDLTSLPTGDWRADMLTVARDTRALLRRHPWLTRLLSSAYGFTPHSLRYLERCMAALEGLDAPGGTKLELLAMINSSVLAFVSDELAVAERARAVPWSPEEEQAVRGAYLAGELGSGHYPHLAAAFAENPGPTDYDAAFERAVGRILDAFARGGPAGG
ncbi:TetR family transcriptional regulator [Streptomyces carminius]|uniref:TetR family transcriptional regulator n=1 Tax=Streptomyces carminius TaxID=2665496 RepID=A0A2M8LPU5_9ACTN|nr:TetR/AcrR family transcriptional regulator C-terminal domain-containing protein [Streptomyces carminius]PJE93977.1 TetR family transcriptional regulator [Streptomyces carminius]